MSDPSQNFEHRDYSEEQLVASLFQTEEYLAAAGTPWDKFVEHSGDALYERSLSSFFFGLGDPLDKQLQDSALQASIELRDLQAQARETNVWNHSRKLRVVELLLKFSDLEDEHELESPTARADLHRQVAVDGLSRIVESINPEQKEE